MDLENKKILVTGGAGFIGSHLVEKLLQLENTVIIYDNFDDFYMGKEKNIEQAKENENLRLIRDDILNFPSLISAMKGVDLLFHLAAQCGVRYSVSYPEKTNRVNVDGTVNVLMAAKQKNIHKIVFASSSSVFGNPTYVPMDEKHPRNPNSPYGASKLAAERYCIAFSRVYGMDITCLRYFSVYGPRGRPDQVVHAFASSILREERPFIYGDGEQTRDFTFVSDIVEATTLAAECEKARGEVFNIGYGKEISINKVYAEIIGEAGKEREIQPIYKESYKGEFPRTCADNRKAGKILGWTPKIGFDEGLSIFINWFTRN